MSTINWIFDNLMDWIAIIALVIVGAIAVYGVFDREKRKTEKDADAADDRLIGLLKGTVDSLSTQVETLKSQVGVLSTKVENLQAENNMLRSILQGRDDKTIKRSEETLNLIKEVSKATAEANKNIQNLYEIMNKFLEKN